ncbi:MAG: hypothetical protein KDD36_03715 [Flavobacteriales bacterium]|nr:hypothetical protein [Flavobacteriales bacterium]
MDMIRYGGICLLLVMLSTGCQKATNYKLVDRTENYTSINGRCTVEYNYPVLVQSSGDSVTLALTGIKEISDFERFIQRFSEGDSNLTVHVQYKILQQTDSLLCLEYTTQMKGHQRKIFHSLTLSPLTLKQYELSDFFKGDYMSVISSHVTAFCEKNKIFLNMRPYEDDRSGYHVNFTVTEDHLILYAGAEGDFHGYYKINIPLIAFELK